MYIFAHFYIYTYFSFLKIFSLYLKFSIITLKRMVMSSAIRLIKYSGVNRPVSVDFKLWIVQQRVKTSPL